MSENESSYYEIALTNRQVMVAFVLLLGCVLLAFLGGVWLGRGQVTPGGEQLQADLTDPSGELGDLEELSFFTDSEQPSGDTARRGDDRPAGDERELDKPDLSQLARKPDPATTLAEDVGRKPPPSRQESRPPPAAESAAKRSPPPTKPKPRQRPAPVPPPVAAAESFVVQVFSTGDEPQARKVLGQLKTAGYRAFLSPVQVSNQTMYRVRLGPYDDRGRAEKAGNEVNRKFKFDTWITAASN